MSLKNCPDKQETAEDLGFESKYLLPIWKHGQVLSALRALCQPDPKYPNGIIDSIYFDTLDFKFLREKADSDYLKTKVRLRWYHTLNGELASSSAFSEIKYRVGTRRQKLHFESNIASESLDQIDLEDPLLLEFGDSLTQVGVLPFEKLLPMFVVRYARYRFIDPISNTRIALDSEISIAKVNRNIFPEAAVMPQFKLDTAVLEFKAKQPGMPRVAMALRHLELRQSSFSKYLEGYLALKGESTCKIIDLSLKDKVGSVLGYF
jgi:hypothetical protein